MKHQTKEEILERFVPEGVKIANKITNSNAIPIEYVLEAMEQYKEHREKEICKKVKEEFNKYSNNEFEMGFFELEKNVMDILTQKEIDNE